MAINSTNLKFLGDHLGIATALSMTGRLAGKAAEQEIKAKRQAQRERPLNAIELDFSLIEQRILAYNLGRGGNSKRLEHAAMVQYLASVGFDPRPRVGTRKDFSTTTGKAQRKAEKRARRLQGDKNAERVQS